MVLDLCIQRVHFSCWLRLGIPERSGGERVQSEAVGPRDHQASEACRRGCDPEPRSNEVESAGMCFVLSMFRGMSLVYEFGVKLLFWSSWS